MSKGNEYRQDSPGINLTKMLVTNVCDGLHPVFITPCWENHSASWCATRLAKERSLETRRGTR